MYKFIELIFNFSTKRKTNFERNIFWGLAIFFMILVSLELIAK